MPTDLLLRHGTWGDVTPSTAGWDHLSFRVLALDGVEALATGENEVVIVPLAGDAHVRGAEGEWDVGGRANVFEALPRSLYLPRDTRVELEGCAELALCMARATQRRVPRAIPPDEVEIEIRGAGNATRQISHIVKPEFPAERILVVEVYTPAGNWSSYPPHKHDEDRGELEALLEETYYFRTRPEQAGAFAVQRLYSPRHGLDLTETVRDGDLLLVPHGYHTTAAAHGYDLYYLNALAGDRRTMQAADDPDLAWIRPSWDELRPDPRVPMVGR
jgi:5-deoxy-glucuronate isomerase